MVFAPHWYDLDALFRKEFGNFTVNVQELSRGAFPLRTFYWGHQSARKNYGLQIKNLVQAGYRSLGEKPVFIGETGVPMDMKSVSSATLVPRLIEWIAKERHSDLETLHGKRA